MKPTTRLLALLLALALGACGGEESVPQMAPSGGGTSTGGGASGDGASGDGSSSGGGTTPARTYPADEIHGETPQAYRPGPEGVTPDRGDTAVLPLLSDIDSLNPYVSQSADASEVHDLLFPRLFHEQADYTKGPPTFKPYLAESYERGADGLSIRFKLREAAWTDGKPITSEDVRFSWEAAKNPEVAWVSASSIAGLVQDVEIHSPREFTVHYAAKYPYQVMDINDIQILPKHAFGQIPFEQWQTHGIWDAQAKVSAGPFKLEKLDPSTEIVLVRNPTYMEEGKPYLDRVVFKVIPDLRTQLTSLLAGDIDAMRSVVPKDAHRVLDDPDLFLYTYVSRVYGYAGWNCKRWPFDDVNVRRAMTYAINRENIVETIFQGYARVAGPHIIRSFWASNPKIEPLPYDPEEAEKLLQESGWKKNASGIYEKDGKPLSFTLRYGSQNVLRGQMCEMMQSDLKKIGVVCEIVPQDFNQLGIQLKKHEFQGYVGAWQVATKVDLRSIWHSEAANGEFNYVHYSNPRVDEIIETARKMDDFEAARPLWYELQDILNRDQPYTMLYESRGLDSVSKRFQNVRVTSLRTYDNLDEWWVKKADQKFKD